MADQRTELGRDPLGLAARKRIVPGIAPLDLALPAQGAAGADALAAQMRERTAQARAVGAEFGQQPVFLTPEEKARLGELAQAGGDPALTFAAAVVRGAGADAPAILAEIGGHAPVLAQAGNLLASGGDPQAARDALEAARLASEVKGATLPYVKPSRAAELARNGLGTAYVAHGEDQVRVVETAKAIAQTRVRRAGVAPDSSEAETIYGRALQEAAGGVFVDGEQFGGVSGYRQGFFQWNTPKVVVPAGVRADRFPDVIRAVTDADLAGLAETADGRPYRARDLHQATPVAVGGGYAFAMGDPAGEDPRYIRGADGNPFVLDWRKFEPILRERAPGAFLGSSR